MSSNAPERPHGQRFSHVYLRENAAPLQDSSRARRRVASLVNSIKDLEGAFAAYLTGELGIDVKWGSVGVRWIETIDSFALRDFLDFFTIAGRYLTHKSRRGMYNPSAQSVLIKEANRIFAEENLRYEIDPAGGVHFKVDAQFAATTNAAIAALGRSRYANAREQFELAMVALSQADIDGKQSIRGVFNATECVFKLMYDRPRLASGDVTKSLKPTVQQLFGADPTALRAATKSVVAFSEWVDACHHYRHEQGVEEPLQPPLDLTVQLVSVGSGFLRWLISIDKQKAEAGGLAT
jgi:hypothetical protein